MKVKRWIPLRLQENEETLGLWRTCQVEEVEQFKCSLERVTVLEMALAELEANWSHVDHIGWYLELMAMAEEMRLVLQSNLVGEEIQ